MEGIQPVTARSRYDALKKFREPYLSRARRLAELTIPNLLPPDGQKGQSLVDPYQSIGGRGVNNISAKMLLALLPPNEPFFRFYPEPDVEEQLRTAEPEEREAVETAIANRENAVLREFEAMQIRPPAYQILRHLVVTGNGLLHAPNKGACRFYPLSNYVVKRNSIGEALEIVTCEKIAPSTLDPEFLALLNTNTPDGSDRPGDEDTLELYTRIHRTSPAKGKKAHWQVYQEVSGVVVPGTSGHHPIDDPQWFALRFSRIDGEDYGRSYVEDYAGDLMIAEALSKALAEAATAGAKVLFGVRPSATTSPKELEAKPNCGFFTGDPEDVWTLKVDKVSDLRSAYDLLGDLRTGLGHAFLLHSAVQRQAERVTAEEVRSMVQELETALGGVYALLIEEFQRPLVRRATRRLERENKLKPLPDGIRTVIVAGLEALGRGQEVARLERAVSATRALIGDEAATALFNPRTIATRLFTGYGVSPKGLLLEQQEVDERNEQAQQAALMQQTAPEMVKQAGNLINNQAAAEAPPAG